MGLNFEFATATKIIFGQGSTDKLSLLLKGLGSNIFLVTGRESSRHTKLVQDLHEKAYQVTTYSIGSEPAVEIVSEGAELVRKNGCTAVVGLGGGSVVDGAKAIAALAPNKGKLIDYLEVIGNGKPLEHSPLPYIAIPTTAGTGAEVTKNAVILSPEHKVKVSLRSDKMFPYAAVIDPALTVSMSREVTAVTGMDALTHLLETFVSNRSNPFIDTLCREGIKRIAESIEMAYEEGSNLRAREDMAFAAMLGGIALANVKLGAVHGFAGPMGGMYSVPHGAVCASLLPAVMKVNFKAVSEQNLRGVIEKYNEIGRLLTGDPEASAIDGIDWVEYVNNKLSIPRLTSFGLSSEDYPELIKKAKIASSMRGNPVVLNDEELNDVLVLAG